MKFNVEVKDKVAVITGEETAYDAAVKAAELDKKTVEKVHKMETEFLNSAVEATIKEAETVFKENKDVEEIEVSVPYGYKKSDKIAGLIIREKEVRVPGKDEKIKKSAIKIGVESSRFNIPKAKIKRMEKELYESILNS